jgi:cytochrome c1
MKVNSIREAGAWAAALGLCCIALASVPAAHAEDKMTAQSLIDRQLILDQITRYYYNFGKAERQSEESFYAEDGELILGTRHYKGKEGIKQAYNRAPAAPPAGTAPAAGATPAVAAAPPRERTAFNVAIENPLIVVHGNTATSQVIFTEYRQEKVGDPMKFTTQGKEYATWVKVNGQWLYKTRQIASGSNPPEGWKE